MDDIKPQIEEEKKPKPVSIDEHPISDEDAKKFAGIGDFSLPVSPLDDLSGLGSDVKEKEEKLAVVDEKKKVEPMSDMPLPAAKPVSPKELEHKAKDLLKELDKTTKQHDAPADGGVAPKKKRSGAATKMALAAVLVVMMGAGGIVGMNLLKMQQVAENRGQAADCVLPKILKCGVCGNPNDFCAVGSESFCQQNSVGNTGFICTCSGSLGAQCPDEGVWQCSTQDFSLCPPANEPPGSGDGYCSSTTCTTEETSNCHVFHYFSPDKDLQNVWVDNCLVNEDQGTVHTIVCWGHTASFEKDCGVEQIDVHCGSDVQPTETISRRYEQDCTTEESPPPTPQPPSPPPSPEPPSPPPSPEPSPEPPVALSCTGLTTSPPISAIEVGTVVKFTCSHTGDEFSYYQYQYKIGTGNWVPLASGVSTLTITQPGVYVAQCRACKADGTCTTWGLAQ